MQYRNSRMKIGRMKGGGTEASIITSDADTRVMLRIQNTRETVCKEDTMLEDVDGADPNDPDPDDYGMYVIESPQWRHEYPSFTGNVYFWPDAFLEEEQYDHVDGYTGGNPTEEQADQLGSSYNLMEFERPNMVEVEYYVWEDANLEDSPQVVSDTEPDASESGWERQEVVGYVWDQTDSPTDRDFVYERSEYVNRLPWYGEEVPPDKCVTDYEGNEECASWDTVSEDRDFYWGWYDSYWRFRGDYEFNYEKVPQYRWTYDVTEEIDLYDYELTEQITVAGTIFPDGTSGTRTRSRRITRRCRRECLCE